MVSIAQSQRLQLVVQINVIRYRHKSNSFARLNQSSIVISVLDTLLKTKVVGSGFEITETKTGISFYFLKSISYRVCKLHLYFKKTFYVKRNARV